MLPVLIDMIIIVLLVGTLAYALVLDRRVRNLMAILRDIEPVVGAFSSAVDQSTRSVEELRNISKAVQRIEPSLEGKRAAVLAPQAAGAGRGKRAKDKNLVRGQVPVPGKSDLVRTFFDITKERKE